MSIIQLFNDIVIRLIMIKNILE